MRVRQPETGERAEFLTELAELTRGGRPGRWPDPEHEKGGAAMPASPVGAGTSFALGAAAATAIAAGERSENVLTNLVFAARHPELGGRAIRAGENALAEEWLRIRETLVRPALRGLGTPATPAGTGQPRSTTWLSRAWKDYYCAETTMMTVQILSSRTPVNPETRRCLRPARRCAVHHRVPGLEHLVLRLPVDRRDLDSVAALLRSRGRRGSRLSPVPHEVRPGPSCGAAWRRPEDLARWASLALTDPGGRPSSYRSHEELAGLDDDGGCATRDLLVSE